MQTPRRLSLLMAALVLAAGCSQEDNDHLAGVGRKLVSRVEKISAGIDARIVKSYKVLNGEKEELPLEERIALRIQWDKKLADLALQVVMSGESIELRGRVADADQRRRVVDLAEQTAGVHNVIDSLEGPK